MYIIEYEISGEIFSIKSYKWYENYNRHKRPLFEMPKNEIISYKIEKKYLLKFLFINFLNEERKIKKIRINISSLSKKNIHKMHIEFSSFLSSKKNYEK